MLGTTMCFRTRKLSSRPVLMAAAAVMTSTSSLFYMMDWLSARPFSVDTGAEVSVLSPGRERRGSKPGPSLKATNGSNIKTYGTRFVKLHLPSGRFTRSFNLVEVSKLILGADFLRANSSLIDITHKGLVNAESFTSIPLNQSNVCKMILNAIFLCRDDYAMLIADFLLITISQFLQVLPKHKDQHHISTCGPPISFWARRLSLEKLTLAKQEFQKMLEMGLSAVLPVFGLRLSIQSPKLQADGGLAETIAVSMLQRCQIDTLSLTYRILQLV